MTPLPGGFLGLEGAPSGEAFAAVRVLPVPYEESVSYEGGTQGGPAAIVTASQQVELYDREFGDEPATRYGVHTLPALEPRFGEDPARLVERVALAVSEIVAAGRLPLVLGGEHTISSGCLRGLLAAAPGPVTIVQIDAHSDLRDSYEGSIWSHASVARRMLEEADVEQLLQLGIRSICPEEVEFARGQGRRVRVWYREALREPGWERELIGRLEGRRVFLTLDVDGLDPSIVPATGTPEPDGLGWDEALGIVRLVARHARIACIDCVELAPRPGLHHADFAIAKLLYKAASYAVRGVPA